MNSPYVSPLNDEERPQWSGKGGREGAGTRAAVGVPRTAPASVRPGVRSQALAGEGAWPLRQP